MTSDAVLREVLDVVDHAYAGVVDPSRWQPALAGIVSLLDARAAGVRVETVGAGVQQEWVGLEESFDRAYVEHYWQHDPWAAEIWSAPVGIVGHGDGVCSRATVEASAFHNELALPSGFDDLAGGVLERTPQRVVTIGIMKGLGTRRFDDATDRVVALVVPHLARAVALRDRLAGPSTRRPSVGVEERLRTEHALTHAEVRVAIRIGSGMSPKEIAVELGSSWNTVRSQLRQIFAKTGRSSQSAIARLVTLLESDVARESAMSVPPGPPAPLGSPR